MPSGLFAKTVGYLPGDIISVTNVAQNKNIDLLVIGALDASEGVAIMLTPEAAEACGIEKGSAKSNRDKVAKITKAQLEEIAKMKMQDLNAASLEAAVSMIKGTARSMGIVVTE